MMGDVNCRYASKVGTKLRMRRSSREAVGRPDVVSACRLPPTSVRFVTPWCSDALPVRPWPSRLRDARCSNSCPSLLSLAAAAAPPQKTRRAASSNSSHSSLVHPRPTAPHTTLSPHIPRAGNPIFIIMSAPTHILFECATGCAIFQVTQVEEIAGKTTAVQEAALDIGNFGRMVKLLSFSPFRSAVDALQSCLDISEGQ